MILFILQTSLTAAGCVLCPAPKSRGTKALVCCSVNCPLPSKMELVNTFSTGQNTHFEDSSLKQIIADAKHCSDGLVLDSSDVRFLDVMSDSVLTEAKRYNIISEPTSRNILLLQKEEIRHFKVEAELTSSNDSRDEGKDDSALHSDPVQSGQSYYLMNRFVVTWKINNEFVSKEVYDDRGLVGKSPNRHQSCVLGNNMVLAVRHMIESDWLYLAKLSEGLDFEDATQQPDSNCEKLILETSDSCSKFARASAKRALQSLKSIPVAARRSLPVLVDNHGRLISIPVSQFIAIPQKLEI